MLQLVNPEQMQVKSACILQSTEDLGMSRSQFFRLSVTSIYNLNYGDWYESEKAAKIAFSRKFSKGAKWQEVKIAK